jgi:hypothetical protein
MNKLIKKILQRSAQTIKHMKCLLAVDNQFEGFCFGVQLDTFIFDIYY